MNHPSTCTLTPEGHHFTSPPLIVHHDGVSSKWIFFDFHISLLIHLSLHPFLPLHLGPLQTSPDRTWSRRDNCHIVIRTSKRGLARDKFVELSKYQYTHPPPPHTHRRTHQRLCGLMLHTILQLCGCRRGDWCCLSRADEEIRNKSVSLDSSY